MNSIEIKNSDIINDLNLFLEIKDNYLDVLSCQDRHLTKEQKEYLLSEEYMQKIIALKNKHNGFPERVVSYSLLKNNIEFNKDAKINSVKKIKELSALYNNFNEEFKAKYCIKRTALSAIYPPGGMISWHNNANASAYNLLFTWSENGDGWFKYRDGKTKEVVTVHDVPGWQFKYGYFGGYDDPESDIIYHAASTNCWRITVAFTFDRSNDSELLQKWFLEDIATEL